MEVEVRLGLCYGFIGSELIIKLRSDLVKVRLWHLWYLMYLINLRSDVEEALFNSCNL